MFVKPTEKCALIVHYQGKSLGPLAIYSYSDAVRYDLAIEGNRLRKQ